MRCIGPDRIEYVLGLPPDSPERLHMEQCPRCSSMLMLYRRFMSGVETPGADLPDADMRLEAFMRDVIDRAAPMEGEKRFSRFARIGEALLRGPAAAAAAAVLVIAAVLWWSPWSGREPVLRGAGDDMPGSGEIYLLPPAVVEDDNVKLSWRPLEGAEGYLVSFRNTGLEEIARFGPSPDTTFVLSGSMLPPGTRSPVLWRVIAVRRGDETGRSAPASLEIPPSEED